MNKSDVGAWREIVESSNTFFGLSVTHTYEYARLQKALGTPVFPMINEDESAVLVAYGRTMHGLRLPILNIIGGPLYRNDIQDYKVFNVFLKYLSRTYRGWIIMFRPPFNYEDKEALHVLCKNGYYPLITPGERYVVNLERELGDIYSHMEKRARYAIRRAQRLGIAVELESSNIFEFYNLYRGSNPPKTILDLKTFELYINTFGRKANIFLAKKESEYLSGAMTLSVNSKLLTYSFGGHHTIRGYSCAAEFLFWHIISWAKERKFKYLDLGHVFEKARPRVPIDKSDLLQSRSKILFVRGFAQYTTSLGSFSSLHPIIYNIIQVPLANTKKLWRK